MNTEGGTALDLAVINATILTLEPDRRVIPRASVAVADGRITAVGDAASVDPERAGKVIDAKGKRRFEAVGYGAVLHDVGQIGIAESVLRKPGRLRRGTPRHATPPLSAPRSFSQCAADST